MDAKCGVEREIRRIEQAALDDIVRRHEKYLAGRIGGQRATLEHADISRLNLVGKNLSNASLIGCSLVEALLAGADFSHATLAGSDLSRANLRSALLVRADLRGACLRNADLTGANLAEADFRDGWLVRRAGDDEPLALPSHRHPIVVPTEVSGATMAHANLTRARMQGTSAVHSDFTDALMRNANLAGADLQNATFKGANLESADLTGANLRGANLRDTILINALISFTEDKQPDLDGALTNARVGRPLKELDGRLSKLIPLHEQWVETGGRIGRQLDLSGFDLRGTKELAHGKLAALKATGAILFAVNLERTGLQAAQLDGADLRSANLAHADLRGVNLTHARLDGANLQHCNLGPLPIDTIRSVVSRLHGATLRHANLRGANLRRADLRRADLSVADITGTQLIDIDLADAVLDGVIGLQQPEAVRPSISATTDATNPTSKPTSIAWRGSPSP